MWQQVAVECSLQFRYVGRAATIPLRYPRSLSSVSSS